MNAVPLEVVCPHCGKGTPVPRSSTQGGAPEMTCRHCARPFHIAEAARNKGGANWHAPTDWHPGTPGGKLRRYDLERMAKTEPPPIDWVVEDIAARGETTLFWGPGGVMKSLLCEAFAVGVAHGDEVAGFECAQGQTAYFDAENGEYEVHRRVRSLGMPASRIAIYDATSLDLASDLDEIKTAVAYEKADLVVFDSLRRLLPGALENDSADMALVVGAVTEVARDCDAACILIHHSRKDRAFFRGSSALRDQVAISYQLDRQENDPDRHRRFLHCDKMRIAEEPERRWLRLAPELETVLIEQAEEPGPEGTAPVAAALAPAILDLLAAQGPLTRPRIAQSLGRTKKDGSVRRVLNKLANDGRVRRDSKGRWRGVPNPKTQGAAGDGTPGAKRGASQDNLAPRRKRARTKQASRTRVRKRRRADS